MLIFNILGLFHNFLMQSYRKNIQLQILDKKILDSVKM